MNFAPLLAIALLIGCDDPGGPIDPMKESDESTLNPPPEVSREVFLRWRDARRGGASPEAQDNPLWSWLLRAEVGAYWANEYFGGPSSFGGQPAWSWDRYGQSTTVLPDGRRVLVAGEHEDHYDPDFFIYNDVTVIHPDGRIEFFGYRLEDFPPTDFHSATLLGDRILLIGNLGYEEQRKSGETPILALDIRTWGVSRQGSAGEGPGWIHDHKAELSADQRSILVTGGIVWESGEGPVIENIDDWRLHLDDWRWERLTRRNWPLVEFSRIDGESNSLWEMEQAVWQEKFGKIKLDDALGGDIEPSAPAHDREAFATLYRPEGVPHEVLPPDPEHEDHRVRRIKVGEVTVRYEQDMWDVRMTVEGVLPDETIRILCDDLVEKLSKVEATKYEFRQLRP